MPTKADTRDGDRPLPPTGAARRTVAGPDDDPLIGQAGSALPSHHVARPRLLRAHVVPPVQLVVAPAGFGKSALIAEVAERAGVDVSLAHIDSRAIGPDAMLMRMRDGLAAAGNLEAAAALTAPNPSASAAADALIAHLSTRDDMVLLAVDGAHLLAPDAMDLLADFAADVPAPHSIIIAARRLEGGLGRLRLLTSTMVVDDELGFREDEARQLFNDHLRLRLTPKTIIALVTATNGSPLQLSVAGTWFARIDDPLDRQDAIDRVIGGDDVVELAVDELLAHAPRRDRRALIRLAALPWADDRVAAAASARSPVLDRLVEAALATRDGSQVRMADAAATLLRTRGTPNSRRAVRRLAATFAAQGELRTCIRTLIDAGMEDRAAATLVGRAPLEIRALSAGDLQALVGSLPDDVVVTHPRLMLQLARAWHSAGRPTERHDALRRAAALGDRVPERLRQAFDVERMVDQGGVDQSVDERMRRRCARILESLDPSAHDVRARVLELVATIEIAGQGDDWAEHAAWCLATAVRAYLADDDPQGAAIARTRLAASVLLPTGQLDEAIDQLDQVIGDRSEHSLLAMALAHRARAHAMRGRIVRANADIEEAARLGRSLGNQSIVGFTSKVRNDIRAIDTTPTTGRVIAASSRSPVAEPDDDVVDVQIRILDTFEVVVDGRPARVRRGLASQLVKIVAIRGGHLHRREAARALWPDNDPSDTVQRIDGLRTGSGLPFPIIDRDEGVLRFVPGVRVDAITFDHLAREARSNGSDIEPIAARAALEYYGELLPGEDAGWITVARERLRQLAAQLIDGLFDDAVARGDMAEALRWARKGRDTDPDSERWPTRIAQITATTAH